MSTPANSNQKERRLEGKDFITIGIYTVIDMVITMLVAILGFIPIFIPLMAVLCPLVGGIPYMLYVTKAKKFGMTAIMGFLIGLLIGLNGAGKSTLARCVCGLEKKCGVLQVNGKALDWKARLKHCYMVMQDTSHQLFTESVTNEILLSMDDEDETVVEQILEQFDLLEYKDRHPLSLSGGQKQRVAIASAIVSNREIIVFDEPTSGLDLKHMREVAQSLKSLAGQGKTLLVITHDPELVMASCSYVIHMEKGQIKENYPLDVNGAKNVLNFFRI